MLLHATTSNIAAATTKARSLLRRMIDLPAHCRPRARSRGLAATPRLMVRVSEFRIFQCQPVTGVASAQRLAVKLQAAVRGRLTASTACSTAGVSSSHWSGIDGSWRSREIGPVGYRAVFLDPSANSRRDLVAFGRSVSTKNADLSVPAVGFKEVETQVGLLHDVTLTFDLKSSNVDFDE